MIGVLLCECQNKIYAAMSGEGEPLDGFTRAIQLLNEKDEKKRWAPCGLVDFSEVMDASGKIPGGQSLFTEQLVLPTNTNLPGACAAPKLIQQAYKDGHKPGSMTEVFYFPPAAVSRAQAKSKKVPVRTSVEVTYMKTIQGITKQETKRFQHGETVPSCATCQIQLTPMLCPTDDPCKS